MSASDEMSRERDRFWYSNPTRRALCPNCGYSVLDIARFHVNLGFDAGARWALIRTSQLSPHIAKFVELLIWLYAGNKDELVNEETGEVWDTWPK